MRVWQIMPVAPHGGAWIEITVIARLVNCKSSPLTEGRGLKSKIVKAMKEADCRPSRRGVD